jgi:hypothetical protein
LLDADRLAIVPLDVAQIHIDKFAESPRRGQMRAPDGWVWNGRTQRWKRPYADLTLVGHFLRADFGRLFGQDFIASLKSNGPENPTRLGVEGRRLFQFAGLGRRRDTKPILEYIWDGSALSAVRVRTRDTCLAFGPAALSHLAETFIGLRKSDDLGEVDKADMLQTFLSRSEDCYAYAIADALMTLLVHERMTDMGRKIYRAFGIPEAEIPSLPATAGARVADFLEATSRKGLTAGSVELSTRNRLRELMRRGGASLFRSEPDASKFGHTTGEVHGGLLLSRSPTRIWHAAPGMLADVDMSGCYPAVAGRMNVYWGRPVILEPGAERMKLGDAVRLVQLHAPEDGWMIRVTGSVKGIPIALIPSSSDARTGDNYRQQRRQRRLQAAASALAREAGEDPGSLRGIQGARLYAERIDSGVVCQATRVVLQALPPQLRQQYEELIVDSVVFYPRAFAAGSGPEFDALIGRHRTAGLPWEQILDPQSWELLRRERLDDDYVTLRYPLGNVVGELVKLRREAREEHGKGSAADSSYKNLANSIYGILASSHYPVGNFVAANHITATARAQAFMMTQALNAIQTITDGVTYRRDQIPAVNFARCIELWPDFPIRRAEEGCGIPFLNPDTIPTDDGEFTVWYRRHARDFLADGGSELEGQLAIHSLEHKRCGKSTATTFDALAADGVGNYVKANLDETGTHKAVEFKARAYGKESKKALQQWILGVYAADKIEGPPPLTEDVELSSLTQAMTHVQGALQAGLSAVYLPLGFENRRASNYRIIKASAFTFNTPIQRAKVLKQIQKFVDRHGVGLEVLALRRAYSGRNHGSVQDLLEMIYELIRKGESNLNKALNATKLPAPLEALLRQRRDDLERRRQEAADDLLRMMCGSENDCDLYLTSFVVSAAEAGNLRPAKHSLELRHPFGLSPPGTAL